MCLINVLWIAVWPIQFHNSVIAIKQIEEKESAVPQQKTTLTGTVLDETGEPIIGAEYLSQRYYRWNYYRFGQALLIGDVDRIPATWLSPI